MKIWTIGIVLATTTTLAVGFMVPAETSAAPKLGPGFQPMVQNLDYSDAGILPVGHRWVNVPRAFLVAREKGLQAMSPDAVEEINVRFFCPNGYVVGKTKRSGEPLTAATTVSGYMRSEWTLAKGELVCTQPSNLKTSLPSWFPKSNPTVTDIRRLGEMWGPNTSVAVGLQIPMPDLSTCVPARLPDGRMTELRSTTPYTADWADGIEGSADATWTMTGGSGLMYQGSGHIGNPVWRNRADYQFVGYYTLSPNEPLSISDPNSTLHSAGRVYDTNQNRGFDAWYVEWDASDGVVPDCGQANLPQSLVAMWNIPRIAWTPRNGWHKSEYSVASERTLGIKDLAASPIDRDKNPPWTSSPGTDDN